MIHLSSKPTAPYGKISSANSTTSTLSGGGTWTGTGEDVTGYTHASVEVVIAPTNALGTLVFQKSTDNTNWIDIDRVITALPLTVPLTFKLISQYFRVQYENGSTAQTTFRLQTRYTNAAPPQPSVNDGNTFTKIADAQLVQNISDHALDIARGKYSYISVEHKFGGKVALSSATTWEPVTGNGIYYMPQSTSATTFRIKAGGSATDTAAGDGAREVTAYGVDSTGAYVSGVVATNGSSASSASSQSFMRWYRFAVTASGRYATTSTSSHEATITCEIGAGSQDLGVITFDNYGYGTSQIAAYPIGLGYTGFIKSYLITVEASKPVDVALWKRPNFLETSAPYSVATLVSEHLGLVGQVPNEPGVPLGPYPALTDLWWMARGATTPDITIDMEIILIKD